MPSFPNASRQYEAREQIWLLNALEKQFAKHWLTILNRAYRNYLKGYEATGETEQSLLEFESEAKMLLFRMASKSIRAFVARLFAQSKAAGIDLETKFNMEQLSDFYIRIYATEILGSKIKGISESTRRQIADMIVHRRQGDLGDAIPTKIAKEIRKLIPGITKSRAQTIARTEIHNAANFGMLRAAQELSIEVEKEWVSIEDSRVRPAHAAANGQKVELNRHFNVGGEMLLTPGDANGSAENVINCRCTMVFHTVNPLLPATPSSPVPAYTPNPTSAITETDKLLSSSFWKNNSRFVDMVQEQSKIGYPNKPTELTQKFLALVDYAMEDTDSVFYRGLALAEDLFAGAEIGDVFNNEMLSSFSTDAYRAFEFTRAWSQDAPTFIVWDGVAKDFESFYERILGGQGDFSHEREHLLQAGKTATITYNELVTLYDFINEYMPEEMWDAISEEEGEDPTIEFIKWIGHKEEEADMKIRVVKVREGRP